MHFKVKAAKERSESWSDRRRNLCNGTLAAYAASHGTHALQAQTPGQAPGSSSAGSATLLRDNMLLHIDSVLTAEEAASYRAALERADWLDGGVTAGYQSARTKHNMQMPEDHPLSRELSARIVVALERNPLFMGAALPFRVFPPLFNRYEGGQAFGTHVDNAVRQMNSTGDRIRTDLSATLFLTNPEDYEGGELMIEDTYGTQSVKLPAGHMVLYPATSLHHVKPVTRGSRISSFFWIQSMVRGDAQRTILFDLDMAVQRLSADVPDHPSAVQLTGIYHNLIRMWAEI